MMSVGGRVLATGAFALALLSALAAAPQVAPAPAPVVTPLEAQDLVVFAPTRPVVLRLVIRVDGVSFRSLWRDRFDRLFDGKDSDHDGVLDRRAAIEIAQMMARPPAEGATANPSVAAIKGESFERAELLEVLEKTSYPFALSEVLSIGRGSAPALFPLLDTNGDGRLSIEELQDAAAHLKCRDFDDDQVLTEAELLASPRRAAEDAAAAAAETLGPSQTAIAGTVYMLGPGIDSKLVTTAIFKRYDLDHNQRLSIGAGSAELPAESKLALLDADSDVNLTEAELAGLAAVEPDVSLNLAFGRKAATATRLSRRNMNAGELKIRRKLDGGYKLQITDLEIDLLRNNRNPSENQPNLRFSNFDFDSNGYVDENEAGMNQATRNSFAAMDTNGDKKVFPAELRAYVESRTGSVSARFTVRVTNRGQDLFTMLDTNGDSTLSQRELKEASLIVMHEDKDGDHALAGGEIPQRMKLELVRGDGSTTPDNQVQQFQITQSRTPSPRANVGGPKWFQKMDRNRDGEVSRDEFLGPGAAFDQLDADHDGFVEIPEAQQAQTAAAR